MSDAIRSFEMVQPIIMIGAMKCGTSSIFKHLELHPEICFPSIKEPEFFSEKMGHPQYKENNYFSLFNLTETHKYIFDGSTGYSKYPAEAGVPKRIFDYGLKPKFIYVVRNPFDRICSHYNFMRKDLEWSNKITSDHLLSVSNYYLQLQQYEEYFSKSDFLIIDFDDLKRDYKTVIKSIYDFVEIKDYVFSEVDIQNNKTKAVNREQLKLKNKLGGKFNFVPKSIRLLIKKLVDKSFKKEIRKLSKQEYDYIHSKLNMDMQKFKKEYGFEVSKWGF